LKENNNVSAAIILASQNTADLALGLPEVGKIFFSLISC
jgi:hypothetical protein